jgi:hypothetical protein
MDKIQCQDTRSQIVKRTEHNPSYAAKMHGNKPFHGADLDADPAPDDAAKLARKTGFDGLSEEVEQTCP